MMSDASEDIAEVAEANGGPSDKQPGPSSAWSAVERDNVFYFETVIFQVRCNLFIHSLYLIQS
jgi:hypothetical protein